MNTTHDGVWPRANTVPPGARLLARVALAVASGLLFAFSLPPHDVEWLGWFAFVPLLVAVCLPGPRSEPRLYTVGLVIICGLSCGLVQAGWTAPKAGALQYALLPYVWIALVIGVVSALATAVRRRLPGGGLRWILTVACAGVAVEWLTTFSPLPVGIALCQYRALPVIQIAAVVGIWGVSWLLWLVNAALADALLRRRFDFGSVGPPLLIVGICLAYGVVRLQGGAGASASPVLKVAAIQDFSGADSGGLALLADNTDTPEKETLIREAAAKGARLIVGTEMAWGAAFRPGDTTDAVSELARETKSLLVVGFEQDGGKDAAGKNFNAAALVGSDGATLGVHHKMRLFLGERQTMRPGAVAHAFASPIGKVGLLICFDSCYTNAARQAVGEGARIIAMPNYDPPTPNAVLHNLHAALMPFRAVENRVAFIRADPNGRSLIIDPTGRIVAETPMYRSEALVAPVHLGDGNGTFFTRWGDWFAYVCVAATLLALTPKRQATGAARSAAPLS